MKTQFFECDCHSDEHTLKFAVDDEEKDKYIYVSVYLNNWQRWYERVWIGIKYIFGYTSKYGHWDCFVMQQSDVPRFRNMLDHLENYKNNVH